LSANSPLTGDFYGFLDEYFFNLVLLNAFSGSSFSHIHNREKIGSPITIEIIVYIVHKVRYLS
jgi:hypothetical protein